MHVRRKSWQRYNYFAYVVDILLISFYLREGQGVTEKMCFVATSVFHEVPFGRKSHASTRKGTQATVKASSDSQEQAGQTEPGTRKGK